MHTDEELRLECLRLAYSSNDGTGDETVKRAKKFYDFASAPLVNSIPAPMIEPTQAIKLLREILGSELDKDSQVYALPPGAGEFSPKDDFVMGVDHKLSRETVTVTVRAFERLLKPADFQKIVLQPIADALRVKVSLAE
jgi:hypothetical protein